MIKTTLKYIDLFRSLFFLVLLAFILAGCQNTKDQVKEIDSELTTLYDKGCNFDTDSINFIKQFERDLGEPVTFHYNLDSLSTRISIKSYDDIKLYTMTVEKCIMLGEGVWTGNDEELMYIQFQGEDKNVYLRKLENWGEIVEIHKIMVLKEYYYVIVSFFINEETNEREGGVIRVLKKVDNKLLRTNTLFPFDNMFEDGRNLRMDNFHFDTETNTVSYDEYGYTPGVDDTLRVIGRDKWELKYYR